jgi:hypothetical protein
LLGHEREANPDGVAYVRTDVITRRGWRAALCTLFALAAAVPLLVTDGGPLAQAVADAAAAPPTQGAAPIPDDAPIPAPEPPPVQRGLAQAAVNAAQEQASSSTELGVAVLDRSTGELVVGERGHERFYTASLSKLIVIVDVLDRRRTEGLRVTDDDLKLVARALGPSDDSAMSALWEKFDGAGAPARVSAKLGLEGTAAPRRFGQWGEVEVTPADYATLWKYVLDDMPDDDRALLISDMKAAPPTAKDGFDQAFGLLAPDIRGDGSGAVAKQGWMCCFSGQYYLHTAGVVDPEERFVVVLLTRQPRTEGWPSARSEQTVIATKAVAALG